MKAVKLFAVLLVGVILGSVGSAFLIKHGTARALMLSGQRLPFELIVTPQTFSEAENAKAVLQAVAMQWVQDTHAEMTRVSKAKRAGNSDAAEEMLLQQTIEWIDKGARELKGTEAEDTMQSYLLSLLLKGRLHDRFLDVYLDVLYRHPTRNLVGRWAKEALVAAKRINREEEVAKAFAHVAAIPFDFPTKNWMDYALKHNKSKREGFSSVQTERIVEQAWQANLSETPITTGLAPRLVN